MKTTEDDEMKQSETNVPRSTHGKLDTRKVVLTNAHAKYIAGTCEKIILKPTLKTGSVG